MADPTKPASLDLLTDDTLLTFKVTRADGTDFRTGHRRGNTRSTNMAKLMRATVTKSVTVYFLDDGSDVDIQAQKHAHYEENHGLGATLERCDVREVGPSDPIDPAWRGQLVCGDIREALTVEQARERSNG